MRKPRAWVGVSPMMPKMGICLWRRKRRMWWKRWAVGAMAKGPAAASAFLGNPILFHLQPTGHLFRETVHLLFPLRLDHSFEGCGER